MLYVGLDRSALVEMRDTEAELYATRDGSGSGYTGTLQRRFGEAMGYPACCTGAFVARLDQGNRAADYYTAVGTLGAGEAPTPWWANHVVAHALRLPFLLHEPCTTRCEETRAGVERAIEALYDANERPLIRRALSMGAVIWPDDTMLLFEPASALQDNAVSVCSLRPPTSGNAVELAPPVSLPEVSGVRIIDDALELHADGQRHIWRRSAGPPRLVVPESAPEHG